MYKMLVISMCAVILCDLQPLMSFPACCAARNTGSPPIRIDAGNLPGQGV